MKTKGPNTISYEYTQENGKITSFKIKQGFTKFGDQVYRTQAINIGFFKEDMSFKEYEKITILDQEVTDV